MELFILGAIFLISILLIRRNFEVSFKVLILISVLLHKELFSIYRWDFLPVRFFMLGLVAYCGYHILNDFIKTRNIRKYLLYLKDPFILIMLFIWVIRGFSIIFSKNIQASILLYGFFTTILFLAVYLDLKLRGNAEKILEYIKFYIGVVFVICLFGIFQLALYLKTGVIVGALWNVPNNIPRVGSTFWDVNHFAALLATLLPVLGSFIIITKELKKRAYYVFSFFLLTGILLLTSSRTAWIIAFVSFISFLTILLMRRFGRKGVIGLLIFMLLISGGLLYEYSDRSSPFRAYVKDRFHYRLDSFASHMMLLEGSYQIFEEYPFLGGGYGGFFEHFRETEVAAEFLGRDPAGLNTRVPPHTIWGEFLSETGIIGFGSLIIFLVVVLAPLLYVALRNKDPQKHLVANTMFSAILGLFTAGVFYSYNSEFFWIVLILYFLYGVSITDKDFSHFEILLKYVKSPKLWTVSILFISALLVYINLGRTHLIPWDEAIYAKVSRNVVETGDYLTLTWKNGNPWFEKPPLGFWLQAISIQALGESSFAVRLPSALFGLATIYLVYFFVKRNFGQFAGYVGALSLVTTTQYLLYTRYAMLDVTLGFFITLSVILYFYALRKETIWFWVGSGISIGLGVMTKGILGFLPLGIIGIHELILIFRKERSLTLDLLKKYFSLVLAALVIFLPWHIAMYAKYGKDFINSYLLYHVFTRATQGIEDKGQPWYWYFIVLKVSMRLWFIALLAAFPYTLYAWYKGNKNAKLYSIWALVIFVFYSIAKSKVVWYIVPLYPVLAIIIGYALGNIFEKIKVLFSWNIQNYLKPLVLFTATVVSLFYLFLVREMVYTPDFDGPKARLLKLKDTELGIEPTLYVHAIEEPLITYYTKGPFVGFDFNIEKGNVPLIPYDRKLIILAKRGRFPGEDFELNGKETKVLGEDGDYVLWYYESDLSLDKDEYERLESVLGRHQGPDTLETIRMRTRLEELELRMAPFLQ